MITFAAKMFVKCVSIPAALFATGLLLFTSTASWAQADLLTAGSTPQPSVMAESGKLEAVVFQIENTLKFKTIVLNPSRSDLSITIRNDQNVIVYHDDMKSTSKYIRKYDLSNLGDGQYSFEISNQKETYRQNFTVATITARQIAIK